MNFDIQTLTQIYNFMLEKKKFEKKENLLIIIDFFRNIHCGDVSFFSYNNYIVSGKFGIHQSLNIESAPSFEKKSEFLNWVYIKINNL